MTYDYGKARRDFIRAEAAQREADLFAVRPFRVPPALRDPDNEANEGYNSNEGYYEVEDTIDGWTAVPPPMKTSPWEGTLGAYTMKEEPASADNLVAHLKGMHIFAPKEEAQGAEFFAGPKGISDEEGLGSLTKLDRHPNSARFHDILMELGDLHDRKQADYGRDADPFANVRGSEDWGMPAWVGAMVRATDKVRRLQTYARKGELANESVEDAFMDLAVYAVIAMVLWEEDQ